MNIGRRVPAISPICNSNGDAVSAAGRSSTCAGGGASTRIAFVIRGAIKRAPESLSPTGRASSSRGVAVVVYCVHGHDVGRDAASRCASAGSTPAISKADSRRGARPADASSHSGAHALGDARAPEDRPHRVPVADPALHRSVGGVLLRAERRSARVRGRQCGDARTTCRTSRTRTTATRCSFDAFIRLHESRRPARSSDLAIDRARRRHQRARSRPAGAGTGRRFARAVGERSPTTTRCCAGACSSTTRSTRRAARRAAKRRMDPAA